MFFITAALTFEKNQSEDDHDEDLSNFFIIIKRIYLIQIFYQALYVKAFQRPKKIFCVSEGSIYLYLGNRCFTPAFEISMHIKMSVGASQ